MDEVGKEARSSQETICQADNCGNLFPSEDAMNYDDEDASTPLSLKPEIDLTMQDDDFGSVHTESGVREPELMMNMDEDAQLPFTHDTSYTKRLYSFRPDPEDESAMESDVDSIKSSSNMGHRRPRPPDKNNLSAATQSSDDDSELCRTTSNIKRRKTQLQRRSKGEDNIDSPNWSPQPLSQRYSPNSVSQMTSPALSVTDTWNNEGDDAPHNSIQNKNNVSLNNSDSNLHASIISRRHSNASEASLNTSVHR